MKNPSVCRTTVGESKEPGETYSPNSHPFCTIENYQGISKFYDLQIVILLQYRQ